MKIPDNLLLSVEKPARYLCTEQNAVIKNPSSVDIRFAFCFPDVYEVGMSHLGLQILYFMMNRRADTYCERAFAPWVDMEAVMRENNIPLLALESGDPLGSFDFIGFTLQYEMSYTNIVNILDLSRIPVYAADRGEEHPVICAGGPCAYNPEPLALAVDFFYIGEGEVVLDEILDRYKANKANGGTKRGFLLSIARLEGVYVPSFYSVEYDGDGKISKFYPIAEGVPKTVNKVFFSELDEAYYPEKMLIPSIETVHDRAVLELFRGCIRGCRFCQAGYVYRPVRERSVGCLVGQAEDLIDDSGYEELTLSSLSTGDYTGFGQLTNELMDTFKESKVNLSLPSLRIDAVNLELLKRTQGIRKSSLTFAPEAGTQRLRDAINKQITEQEILEGCELAFSHGWDRLKLYFMIGLPTETDEDVNGIIKISEDIAAKGGKKGRIKIALSASNFVPKPFTPFQWEKMNDIEELRRKQRDIKRGITKKQISFSYHDTQTSQIEGVLARGDRRVLKAVIRAWALGARFDGWSEKFNYAIWSQAFADAGLSMGFYTRERDTDEILPWDHISCGVSKEFLLSERERAYSGETTDNCRESCRNCGVGCMGV